MTRAAPDSTMPEVRGTVSPGFEPLRDLMSEALEAEAGCALSIWLDGRPACDLWAGEAQPGRPWQRDTLCLAFSVGKGLTTLCVQLLAGRGELDIEAPVTRYWPEFAQAGKEAVTVRMLLGHTVGLPTFPRYWDAIGPDGRGLEDWELMTARLAAAPPAWTPGTHYQYHAITFGYLVGEVVRRISGMSLGRFFATEVAEPLSLQTWIGTPPEVHHRLAPLQPAPPLPDTPATRAWQQVVDASREAVAAGDAYAPAALAFASPILLHPAVTDLQTHVPELFNRPWIHEAEIPASNPITDARSLAQMYGHLAVGGFAEITPRLVEEFTVPEPQAVAAGLPQPTLVGYHLVLSERRPAQAPGRPFGHAGAGGSLGFADPALRLGFGYVKNRMLDGVWTKRFVDAAYDCAASAT